MEAEDDAGAGGLAKKFFNRLATIRGEDDGNLNHYAEEARAELGYLDHPNEDPPTCLPKTALWLAAAWQAPIVQAELPVVAREALATPSRRDQSWASEVLRSAGQGAVAEAAARLAVARVASGRRARLERGKPTPPGGSVQPGPPSVVALLPDCPVPNETL